MVVALTLTACGSDDSDDSSVATPATSPDVAAVTTDAPSSSIEPTESTASDTVAPVVVEHALGTTEIVTKPERIVSASVSMTGPLLAMDAPVVATMTTQPGLVADDNGFFLQWADVAVEREVESIPGPELNLEAIAAAQPDLIVANAVGGQDAVTEEMYALLSEIAPTVAYDVTGTPMGELTTELGTATWLGDDAEAAVAEVESHLTEVAGTIDTSTPVAIFTLGDGVLNVFTAESAQGGVVDELGLTMVEIEAPAMNGEGGSGQRRDVVQLSTELLDQLGDSTLFVMLADQAALDTAIAEIPTLAALPAVAEERIHPLGNDVFRIDPFSAIILADKLAAALQAP